MGNWNRHFVRVGSDGNMGVFDQKGNRFIRENLGSDNLPARIAIIPSSIDNNTTSVPPETSAIEFESQISAPRINPNSGVVLNLGTNTTGYLQYDFDQNVIMFRKGILDEFKGINGSMNGFTLLSGSPYDVDCNSGHFLVVYHQSAFCGIAPVQCQVVSCLHYSGRIAVTYEY